MKPLRLPVASCLITALLVGSLFGVACQNGSTPTPGAALSATPTTAPLWTKTPASTPPTPMPTTAPAQAFVVQDLPLQSWRNVNAVTALVADDAYIWAATPAGLVRWDSSMQQPHVFGTEQGLASAAIAALSVDGAGRLWISYSDRPEWTYYDGTTWTSLPRLEAVELAFAEMQTPRHADTAMWAASQVTGWVWIPSETGLVKAYDGATWRSYGSYSGVRNNIVRVTVSSQGRVWALGDGLCTAIEGYVWWQDHTLFADIPDASSVTGIATDSAERVWLSFVNATGNVGGLCNLDLDEERWTGHVHGLNAAIPGQVLGLQIAQDESICVWGQGGLAMKEPASAWRAIGFADTTVNCSFTDSAGNRWMGTDRGIVRVNQAAEMAGPWLLPQSTTLGDIANVTYSDTLWLATDDGLTNVRNGGFDIQAELDVLWLGAAPDDTVWYSVPGLLANSNPTRPALEGQDILCATFSADRGWAYAADGTLWMLNEAWRSVMSLLDLGPDPVVDMTPGPNGELYLATASHAYRLDDEQTLTQLGPQEGVVLDDIRQLAAGADGVLWAATSHGLYRTPDGANWVMLTTASTGGGLQSMDIRDLAFDAKGNLWVATRAGISCRTPEVDWYYLSMPETTQLTLEGTTAVWGLSSSGLYRATLAAFTPVE